MSGPVPALEQALERVADVARREVLRLDVDRLPGGGEHVGGQRRRLLDRGTAAVGRHGAGDGDLDSGHRRLQSPGPDRGASLRDGRRLAGRRLPAGAGKVAQRPGGVAVHRHLQIVDRSVGLAIGIAAQGIVRPVPGGVPALHRQVHPAREGDGVVDADELLVVGGVERVVGVELELDPRMVLPLGAEDQRQRGAGSVHGGDAPDQDPHLQAGPRLDEEAQERPERRRGVLVGVVAQADAAVEVPADDEDRAPRLPQGTLQGGEVVGAVDQHGRALRPGDAPAVAPRGEEAGSRRPGGNRLVRFDPLRHGQRVRSHRYARHIP
ncbi:MAG: hypothetical protein PGN34_21945 [Methylobacterium frigidaeris]